MRVVISQLNLKIAAVEENLKKTLEALEEAKRSKADLIIFPELTFIGYPPRDLLENNNLIRENILAAEKLGAQSEGITLVTSVAEPNPEMGAKPLFNVAQVWQNGKCILKYKKRLFPYYDVFDEERHFESGKEKGFFLIGSKKVAVTICEDIWGKKGYEWRYHGRDLTQELKEDKPDLVINLSASPFQIGKPERRVSLLKEITAELKCPVVYCNQVGANDELLFDGSSLIVDEKAQLVVRLPAFEEKTVTYELGQSTQLSLSPQTNIEWIYHGLVLGIRDYFRKTNNAKAILGLSGGIDSSVVLALVVKALGSQNVKAVALPSKFNAQISHDDAKTLAANLNVEFQTISIEPLVEGFTKQVKLSGLAAENIQPRIRMTLLMALANAENRILLNTSNKSEIACGYATLYGDSAGALSVIGDLKKFEVYALAKYINEASEVIPKRVIERAPSAELRENQTDQDTLPAYEVLDKIVELFIEKAKSYQEILQSGVDKKSLDTFLKLYQSSEYKRRQLPPVLRVSEKAFGMGRRIPVVRFTQ